MLRFEDTFLDHLIPESWFRFILAPSFLLAVLCRVLLGYTDSSQIESLCQLGIFANLLIVLSWAYRRSVYRHVKWYRSIDIAKALIILFALSKIMHWEYAHLILWTAVASALLPYLYFAITQKRPLSTWVARIGFGAYFLAGILRFLHLPYTEELSVLGILALNLYALYYSKTPSLIRE